jgi:hypothetical protein
MESDGTSPPGASGLDRRSARRIDPGERGVILFDGVRLSVGDMARGGFRIFVPPPLRFVPGAIYEFDLLLKPKRRFRFGGGSVAARCVWHRAGQAGFRLTDPARAIDIADLT